MARPTPFVTVTTCLFMSLLVSVLVLPRVWIDLIERHAAQDAVVPVLQQSIQSAVGVVAPKVLPVSHVEDDVIRPDVDAAPVEAPVQVEREAYSITLPPASVVDPESAVVGSEHLMTSTLPGDGTVSIIVLDDKSRAAQSYDGLLASFRAKYPEAQEQNTAALNSLRFTRATAMSFTNDGVDFAYEIGQTEGWDKAFVFLVEYPANRNGVMARRVGTTLKTFRMKQ
jgi:hypothetical protein